MSFNGDLYPTAGADVVMSTKGDLVRYDSQRERYGIGSANQILQVKSGLPSWETLSTAGSILTTQGDILYENASGLARLGFGTSGDVLTTKGTGADPVWATPSVAGLELIEHYEEAAATASSKTFTFTADMTDDYGCVFLLASYFSLNGQLYVTINNNTSAIYAQGGYVNAGSSRSDTGQNQLSINHDTTVGDTKTSCMSIYGNSADGRLNGFWTEQASLTSFETGGFYVGASMSGTISSIELTTSANTWAQGSTFDVYGWKI